MFHELGDLIFVEYGVDEDAQPRDIYGRHLHEKACYTCPHRGTTWTDDERIANLRRAERDGGAGGCPPRKAPSPAST